MHIKNNLRRLLVIFTVCYSLNVSAQVNESENFVYLYSDSVVYAKNIRLRTTFFNSLQLRADSKPIPLKQVKFFKNDEGFFANIGRVNTMRTEALAVRVIEGKINFFEERSLSNLHSFFNQHDPQYYHPPTVDVRMFYNKGYDDLKKVNYKNLAFDMGDDVQSLDILAGYRKNMMTSKTLYIAAGASVAAALIALIVNANNKQESLKEHSFGENFPSFNDKQSGRFNASIPLVGLGAGLGIGGYLVNQSGLRKLERAIDTYNR